MINIYDSFENLDEKKRQAIINAGFKVFGESGYRKASMEEIAGEAGISKGSLFYYFKSKKNFYMYLYEYSAAGMKLMIDNSGDDGNPSYLKKTDFFERLEYIRNKKSKYSMSYPMVFRFMKSVVFEECPAVLNDIAKYNRSVIAERTEDFYRNLDTYKFKDNVDIRMVLQLLTWCGEGCANQTLYKQRLMNVNAAKEENFKEMITLYNSYVELIRKHFYKEEFL